MAGTTQEYLGFALEVARAAAPMVLSTFQDPAGWTKPDGTEVTEADIRTERFLREKIARRYPRHEVLGEELGGSPEGEYVWVLDPIDGTAWYAMGAPLFGTLVALLHHGEPIIGVVHMPALGETLFAGRSLGSWFERGASTPVRVHCRPPVGVRELVITASGIQHSDLADDEPLRCHLRSLVKTVRKFRFYGDCVQHVLVAQGKTHAAIDTVMRVWDSAALIPCIEEAGGMTSTIEGSRERVAFGGTLVSSCHPSVHEMLLEHLRPVGVPRDAALASESAFRRPRWMQEQELLAGGSATVAAGGEDAAPVPPASVPRRSGS